MKTKLSGLDRIMIPALLPTSGGKVEQILVKEIIDILVIHSEEILEFDLRDRPDGGLQWNAVKIQIEKEFDLKKQHTDLLKEAVITLDKNKGWNQNNLGTCLKIEKMR